MGCKKVFSSIATLVISAGVTGGIVFLGASAQTKAPGIELDCRGDLRIAATFETAADVPGAKSSTAAAKKLAGVALRDYDDVTSQDGVRIIVDGDRRVAAVG